MVSFRPLVEALLKHETSHFYSVQLGHGLTFRQRQNTLMESGVKPGYGIYWVTWKRS